jgi:hypothetical protein
MQRVINGFIENGYFTLEAQEFKEKIKNKKEGD